MPELPKPGEQFDDFEMLHVLGEGSFGKVFLARQLSLDRQVALKVTANRGSEARTLASLEHDHIVHVFSETVDAARNLRLLCMQYVAGTTLERIIEWLGQRPREARSGRAILDAVDSLSAQPAAFHPAALRDRELLAGADLAQAVCWIGTRLAEALDYAHGQGVRHRDIKPANILMNQYGRPMLADFNLSLDSARAAGAELFGGTLAYMAPEHLAAFNPDETTCSDAVDERSDIYSLGVVLFELFAGCRPFERVPPGVTRGETLRRMAAARRAGAPALCQAAPDAPETLDRILQRCLTPEPAQRYQTAAELARALDGCRGLQRAQAELPPPGPLTRYALKWPFIMLGLLTLLPHVIGSIVNVSYNGLEIVGKLTEPQKKTFGWLVMGYNAVAYPFCLWLLWRLMKPVLQSWQQLMSGGSTANAHVDEVRRNMLSWPLSVVVISCIGWLPGGLLFPLAMHVGSGPVGAGVFGHFLISFTISCLIALTYSFFGVQFMVLRVLYPRLWLDAQDFEQQASAELSSVGPRLRLFQLLAGLIPLAGAVLMIGVGPETSGYRAFRLLVTALIALGMAGFGVAVMANNLLSRTVSVLGGIRRAARIASR